MNPNPLLSLNHFTVPCAMKEPSLVAGGSAALWSRGGRAPAGRIGSRPFAGVSNYSCYGQPERGIAERPEREFPRGSGTVPVLSERGPLHYRAEEEPLRERPPAREQTHRRRAQPVRPCLQREEGGQRFERDRAQIAQDRIRGCGGEAVSEVGLQRVMVLLAAVVLGPGGDA